MAPSLRSARPMRWLLPVLVALAGCDLYDVTPGPKYTIPPDAWVTWDSGPPCDFCPATRPTSYCSHHLDGKACFYWPSEVCACTSGQWRCGTVGIYDAGVLDAAIPPDAP
jgi:hypothetical protein